MFHLHLDFRANLRGFPLLNPPLGRYKMTSKLDSNRPTLPETFSHLKLGENLEIQKSKFGASQGSGSQKLWQLLVSGRVRWNYKIYIPTLGSSENHLQNANFLGIC